MGVIAGMLATVVQYYLTNSLMLVDMFDTMMDGLKTMLSVLVILVSVFSLIESNARIGFTARAVELVSPE